MNCPPEIGIPAHGRHSVAAASASLLANQNKEVKNDTPSSMLQCHGSAAFPTVILALITGLSLSWHHPTYKRRGLQGLTSVILIFSWITFELMDFYFLPNTVDGSQGAQGLVFVITRGWIGTQIPGMKMIQPVFPTLSTGKTGQGSPRRFLLIMAKRTNKQRFCCRYF